MGPGDKLQVNLYGNDNDKFQSFISREGSFFLPPLGPVNLSGLTFGEASELIKQRVKSELIGTNASVSLSEIRSIYVYMLGEVYQPGKYTMSGLSSLFQCLDSKRRCKSKMAR